MDYENLFQSNLDQIVEPHNLVQTGNLTNAFMNYAQTQVLANNFSDMFVE